MTIATRTDIHCKFWRVSEWVTELITERLAQRPGLVTDARTGLEVHAFSAIGGKLSFSSGLRISEALG